VDAEEDGDGLQLRFRPLSEADLPLLHRWLNAPHVRRWWDGTMSMNEVVDKYRLRLEPGHHVRSYVALAPDVPIGFLQWYAIGAEPGYLPDHHGDVDLDPRAAGVDLYIGEESYLHRGVGHRMLRCFVEEVVLPTGDIPYAVVDPAPTNHRAICAYERAGFVAFAEIEREDGPALLMRTGGTR
jgi:RimJ/RimL family protein N-acetyltransferase